MKAKDEQRRSQCRIVRGEEVCLSTPDGRAQIAANDNPRLLVDSAREICSRTLRPADDCLEKNKFINDEDVNKKFGVKADKVIDVQALAGDSTDNVPGVPGIGVKTAAELIKEYGDLENLLKNATKIKQNKRRETLIENKDKAMKLII